MRRPPRNIEIFSMSVLDMFASALGAFIMICVILFPYFKNDKILRETEAKVAAINKDLVVIDQQLTDQNPKSFSRRAELRENPDATSLEECLKKAEKCKVDLSKVFLVIAMEWEE